MFLNMEAALVTTGVKVRLLLVTLVGYEEGEKCKDEIREAAYRIYGSFRVEVEISDLTLITKDPILVHKLRISITSK